MLKRAENDQRTNREIVFFHVLELHEFLRNPSMGLDENEWKSLKKLIASCEALIDLENL